MTLAELSDEVGSSTDPPQPAPKLTTTKEAIPTSDFILQLHSNVTPAAEEGVCAASDDRKLVLGDRNDNRYAIRAALCLLSVHIKSIMLTVHDVTYSLTRERFAISRGLRNVRREDETAC